MYPDISMDPGSSEGISIYLQITWPSLSTVMAGRNAGEVGCPCMEDPGPWQTIHMGRPQPWERTNSVILPESEIGRVLDQASGNREAHFQRVYTSYLTWIDSVWFLQKFKNWINIKLTSLHEPNAINFGQCNANKLRWCKRNVLSSTDPLQMKVYAIEANAWLAGHSQNYLF